MNTATKIEFSDNPEYAPLVSLVKDLDAHLRRGRIITSIGRAFTCLNFGIALIRAFELFFTDDPAFFCVVLLLNHFATGLFTYVTWRKTRKTMRHMQAARDNIIRFMQCAPWQETAREHYCEQAYTALNNL